MDPRNKVALVTGGAAGIGNGIAERLRRAGASVLIADLDVDAGRRESERLGATFVSADVATEDGVRKMMALAAREYDGLDILINNAGGTTSPGYPEGPFERWSRTLDLNLRGPMLAIQLAIPLMKRRGAGSVVNVASVAGLGRNAHAFPEYAAAKAGLVRLTGTLAPLSERVGVRVNCVCPDWVDTPASRRIRADMSVAERNALPPILSPEEVAGAVVRLIEDETLVGRVMVLSGGKAARLLPVTDWSET